MMGTIGCPETSVRIYHTMLRKIPEDRRSHLHRGGSLKSQKLKHFPKMGLRQTECKDVKLIQLDLAQDSSVLLVERLMVPQGLNSWRVKSSLTLCVRWAGKRGVALGGPQTSILFKEAVRFLSPWRNWSRGARRPHFHAFTITLGRTLRMSDQLFAETSTWQHSTDSSPPPLPHTHRNLKLVSQQAFSSRSTP
jgi:hypothetical protein